MRDDLRDDTRDDTTHRRQPRAPERLDPRLTSAADETARCLRPVAADWSADDFGALVYAEALVRLKHTLPRAAYEGLERHYRAHRAAFLARLQPPAD
jgi:hypothetical protein